MAHILIIDDDRSICEFFSELLGNAGHSITTSLLLHEGIGKSNQADFDVVLLDVQLPDGNGLAALPQIRNSPGNPEIIIITGEGDPDGAELAIKSGAWDYLQKPLLIDPTLLTINRALLYHRERKQTNSLENFDRRKIIGKSSRINESLLQAARAARSDLNTLITGETGTGKELFARAIHQNSPRKNGSFTVVDCTALPKNLAESILFGHEKGAFTGADKASEGLIKTAHNGTLFLDEVGELPLSIQKTFLRVLQEKKYRPIGGKTERNSDFVLISATNRDLDSAVEQGKFRHDLLFRLRTMNIELPPLRNRDDDIRIISEEHIARFCESRGIPVKSISSEFITALSTYKWPGNVRELINALENALSVAGESTILYPNHLPTAIRAKIAKISIRPEENVALLQEKYPDKPSRVDTFKQFRDRILQQAEQSYLEDLMNATDWSIKKACKTAGLSRARLYGLLKKHKISRN